MLLEFTLAGIPLIFAWLSVVQMALGSWRYQTLQYAVQTANSYIASHGSNCSKMTNHCSIEIQHAATVFRNAATGIPADAVSLTFHAYKSDHVTESPTTVTCTLTDCLSDTTTWPPAGFNDPGADIEIGARYLAGNSGGQMLAGGAYVSVIGNALPAYSRQMVMF